MTKLLQLSAGLQVREGGRGEPLAFLYRGKERKVGQVLMTWRISQEWWKRPVERDYFRVSTEDGAVCELYRDLLSGAWHLQRIYD